MSSGIWVLYSDDPVYENQGKPVYWDHLPTQKELKAVVLPEIGVKKLLEEKQAVIRNIQYTLEEVVFAKEVEDG